MHLRTLNKEYTTSKRSMAFNVTHMLTPAEMSLCDFESFLKVTLTDSILYIEILDDTTSISQEIIGKMSAEFQYAKKRLAQQKKDIASAHIKLMSFLEDATGMPSD